MKNLPFVFLLAALIMSACNNNKSNQKAGADTSGADSGLVKIDEDLSEFITEALNSGATEVELGELAQTRGSNQRVKAFGSMMVRDHTAAGDELKVIAAKRNIVTAQILEGDHLKDVEDLKQQTGVDFDKKYIKMMLSDHRKNIKMFEDMAEDDDGDAEVKAFAAKTLPKLKMHLDSAKAINKEVKGSTEKDDN
jgi:putative membrane protein